MTTELLPILLHGLERLMISGGAIAFGFLGYKLFRHGLTGGRANLQFSSRLAQVVFTGTGPGLFFMAFGAVVLIIALLRGSVRIDSKVDGVLLPKWEEQTLPVLHKESSKLEYLGK